MRMPARTDAGDRDKIIDCIISIMDGIKCGTVTLAKGTANRTVVKDERTKGISPSHAVLLTPTNATAAAGMRSIDVGFGSGSTQFDQFTIFHQLDSVNDRTLNWIAIAR